MSTRNIMNNAQLHQIYIENIDVLYSNLFENIDVDISDLVFRDVKFWVEHVKRFKNLKITWILDACFQNFVKQWCDIYSMSRILKTSNVKFICFFLIKKFVMTKQKQEIKSELVWEKLIENLTRKKQQVKHARLAKEIEKTRIKKKRAKVFVCKRCFVKFSNNIKLHQHVQNYHQKKFATKLLKHIFTSSSNELVLFVLNEIVLFSKSLVISLLTSSFTSFSTSSEIFIEFTLFAISLATSKTQIFWATITSKFASSKFSRLSRFVLKFLENASIIFALILTLISTRFYMTINDLFVIFNKKSKSLDLSHRQKSKFSSYHWQLNKLVIFIFHQTRITSYFLSSFNSFKFNILSKSKLCLFIQINVLRRHIFFCEQNINFVSQIASFFDRFINISHICHRCK